MSMDDEAAAVEPLRGRWVQVTERGTKQWVNDRDNAETREAAAHWLSRHRDRDDYDLHTAQDALDDAWGVIAALPPVAGPEVRPDETLRAGLTEFHCADRGSDTHDTLVCKPHPAPAPAPPPSRLRCSTCGGTGLVDWDPGQQRSSEEDQQPCPDCDGRPWCTFCAGPHTREDCREPFACGTWPYRGSDQDLATEADNAAVHLARGCCGPAPAPGDEGLRARIEALCDPAPAATEVGEGQ